MLGLDQSELRPLTKLFDDARRLYEDVMNRRAGDTGLDRSSYDATDISDLDTALSMLSSVRATLGSKSDREKWLLHLAGIEWQQAQVLFALGRLDDAAAANERMRSLIPQVPQHMWTPYKEQEYRSNCYFMTGQLAAERGARDVAIEEFQNSLRIDRAIGDVGGAIACARRLELLGVATQPGTIVLDRVRTMRMDSGSMVVFVFSYLAGFYLALWWAVVLLAIDLNASWALIGNDARKMQLILIVAPALAAILGTVVSMASSAVLLSVMRTVRPRWEAFIKVAFDFIYPTMIVSSALALMVVGRTTAEAWIASIGQSFYLVYFIVAPVVGLVGGLVWLAAVGALRNH